MMSESIIQRSFGSGELAPALHARADVARYIQGLRTCRNFVVAKAGGVVRRAGLRFIGQCKTSGTSAQLLRYESEVDGESLLLEAGAGYIRFYKGGALVRLAAAPGWDPATAFEQGDVVTHGGTHYYAIDGSTNQEPPNALYWYPLEDDILEVPTPFPGPFSWVQTGRVITLTHPEVRPHELIYQDLTRWIIRPVDTEPQTPAPENLALTPGAAGGRYYGYVVTAAGPTYEESEPSNLVVNAACAEATPDAPNQLSWDAVPDAAEYYVYCDPYGNGTLGYIGTATGVTSFKDPGIVPDFSSTPPIPRAMFQAADEYPRVAGYYQQRRLFANTVNEPDMVWGSKVGQPCDFSISSPLQDDDSISFRLAGTQNHPIRHIVGLKQLVVLTDGGAWTVGEPKQPLTPSSLGADQETWAGASSVRPVVVGNNLVYVQARGSIVRDLRFQEEVQSFAGNDLTIFASHLFAGYTIRALDVAQVPDPIVWAVRSDGRLLGLTYLPEHDVWGWHRHDTGASGVFWDVCVVPENDQDAVYVIVRREIDGSMVRYIERLEAREGGEFFIDSGLSYDGPPVANIAGLDHLEGETVAIVGDGADLGTGTVVGGQVALLSAHSVIHAGLPITSELETLDLDVHGSDLRDRRKRVQSVTLLVHDSSRTFQVGPDSGHLRPYRSALYEGTAARYSGECGLNLMSEFGPAGRLLVRHTAPLPLTVLGIIPYVEVGG